MRLKVGQWVVWKSPVPEERLRGQVVIVQPTGVLIRFDALDPQKALTTEIVTRAGGTGVRVGLQAGHERYFLWPEFEQYLSVEEDA